MALNRDGDDGRSATADVQSITKQIYLYCRAMDRMDIKLGCSVWHEDGEADYGTAIYVGSGRGFVEYATAQHRALIAHSHQVTNVLIELDGDRAASESYVTAALRMNGEAGLQQLTTRGRYLDRWSYRQGKWGIDKRIYVHDFDDIRSVPQISLQGTSSRDLSDPSYDVLKLKG